MKKLLPLFLALLAPVAFAASTFEGKVTMTMTGPKNAPTAMTFSLKEGFSRIDMNSGGQNMAVLFEAGKQQMTVLLVDQHMYMTQSIAAATKMAASAGGTENAAVAAASGSVAVTTAKEKILGYDCVKYVAQAKDGTSEIWVTDQLGSFLGFGPPASGGGRRGPGAGAAAPQGWEEAIMGKGVFPLRVITTLGGKETFRLEATAVEKTSVPAAAFYPPTDFQDLSAMLKGMGMPGGIPGMPGGMKLPGGE